jgi:hypothetical protein
VQSAWLERGVEIGFVVGAVVCFVGGFLRVLKGGNITGGLVAMACSPLAGLFLGAVFGAAAHIAQAAWARLVGTPDASKLQAHETLSKTDSLAPPTLPESPTDVTTSARGGAGITQLPDDLPDTRTYPCEPPPSPSAH